LNNETLVVSNKTKLKTFWSEVVNKIVISCTPDREIPRDGQCEIF